MIDEGKYGKMAALKGNTIEAVPLADATDETKTVGEEWFEVLDALKA
jgi:hypothetical protein